MKNLDWGKPHLHIRHTLNPSKIKSANIHLQY